MTTLSVYFVIIRIQKHFGEFACCFSCASLTVFFFFFFRVWDHLKRRSSCQTLPTARKIGLVRELNHPAFESIAIKACPEGEGRGHTLQTVLRVGKLVTALAMSQCLQFIYTGTISYSSVTDLQEIRQAAEFLELPELLMTVSNIQTREEFLNADLRVCFRQVNMRLTQVADLRAADFQRIFFSVFQAPKKQKLKEQIPKN